MSTTQLSDPPRPPATWLVVLLLGVTLSALLLGVWLAPTLRDAWSRLTPSPVAAAESGDGTWYQSQMHPWIIQPYPGTCPICGMDLSPVDPQRFGAEVTIAPITVQNIGVRSQPVQRGDVQRSIRSVGVVSWDPGRMHDINMRAAGWVERLSVDAPGDRVRKGQILFYLTSPQLAVAQSEYLRASDPAERAASARKLAWLGMTDLDALREAGEALEWVPIRSPSDGVVTERNITDGARVENGTRALRLVDDAQVWLEITLFEQQLDDLRPGLPVTIEILDGKELAGELAYIEPTIDPRTRAVQARVVLDNPDQQLREGAYARARIALPAQPDQLLIPRSSVVSSGTRHVVFIDLGRSRFAPREVTLGATDDQNRVVITSGLKAGEEVVTSGQFLIDAEARMVESIARMVFPDRLAEEAETREDVPKDATEENQTTHEDTPLTGLLRAYQALAAALYSDDEQQARQLLVALATALAAGEFPGAADHAVTTMQNSDDMAELRHAFGALSIILRDYLQAHPQPAAQGWSIFHCGMAPAPDKGWWLQANDDEVRNPFFGAAHGMRHCVSTVRPLAEDNQ